MTDKKYYSQWYAKNRKKRIASVRLYQKKHHKEYSEWQKQYKKKHKKQKTEYIKFWNIKRKYGLSKTDYNNLLKRQNYKCAVCGFSLLTDEIHVAHCHKSGKVRGILHRDCNLLIGFSKENVEILKKAIQYIRKHSKRK